MHLLTPCSVGYSFWSTSYRPPQIPHISFSPSIYHIYYAPCSYKTLTWTAFLPSFMTSYVIFVHQTRDLPIGYYIPHIQLPSDSTMMVTLIFGYILPTTGQIRKRQTLYSSPNTSCRTGNNAPFSKEFC